jgi:magnesium chelatase family protein
MPLFKTRTAAIYGVDALPIDVEVDMYLGDPKNFITVGLPDTAVRESRERIKSSLINAGFGYPAKAVTVNLAPANIRKEGAGFDLPMALGIMGAMGSIPADALENFLVVGELSLGGGVRPVRGALPTAVCAKKEGIPNIIVPKANAPEAAVVAGVNVYGVEYLADVVRLIEEPESRQPVRCGPALNGEHSQRGPAYDFRDVKGQETAKRALEIAASGGHNILMVGPPGSGKTMLAKRFSGILPGLTFEEAIETTKVHSVSGVLDAGVGLIRERPFRAPHHSISNAGLVGGGMGMAKPGEVSLAHNGVLFLDEFPEFPRNVLELLRQPLEDGQITIVRSDLSLTFPSSFMLVSAMNPCPCGYFGDSARECRCTPMQIQRYVGKISGPLLDRIDIHVEVPPVKYRELRSEQQAESSQAIRARAEAARAVQMRRGYPNARMPSNLIREHCKLDEQGERTLEMAVQRMGLSARAHDRILKVSRTIADLGGQERIAVKHLAEAVQYRSLDRTYWA